MRENYRPWEINVDAFFEQKSEKDALAFLIRFAVLAPSSHNSQPWRFRVKGRSIWVIADQDRRLKDSDKDDRQLFISLGCAMANILIAADYYGLSGRVVYLPDDADHYCAARIDFSFEEKGRIVDGGHLIFSILERVNNRNAYTIVPPDEAFIARAKALGTSSLHITFVSDRSTKERLADIALAAGIRAMEDGYFRKELSRYVKSNTTQSHVGMPAFGMGIPTPVSFFVPNMIKFLNMNKLSMRKDEILLKRSTPMFCVISTGANTKDAWIKAGEAYERIALAACCHRLSTAVWAAPVQIGEYYKDIQEVLGTTFRPQMFFRVGYPTKAMAHSPRIPAEKVIIHS